MGKRTILIVEDDAPVREMMRDTLSSHYDVLSAACYSEAVTKIKDSFHIALVDYVLPDGDGLDLVKMMRRQKPAVPIIFMTAYDHKTAALNAARAGATAYMNKPVSLRILVGKVSALLEEGVTPVALESDSSPMDVERRKDFLMDGIKGHMDKNFMEKMTLDGLAEMARMTRFDLCKAFKKRFGTSCISYLNEVRIRNAAELLSNRDLNITEVAVFVGFSSVEYFDRVFSASHGISPREYRRKVFSAESE